MNSLEQAAQTLGQQLLLKGYLLALAESCTGGLVAQSVTAIEGSSQWFDCGFVTYSNAAKSRLLDVSTTLIATHGAVSEPVAQAMALGAIVHSEAQISGAITGIAGPGGGTPAKPVGTVCFAWGVAQDLNGVVIDTETMLFVGDRQQVRHQAALHLLNGLFARSLVL